MLSHSLVNNNKHFSLATNGRTSGLIKLLSLELFEMLFILNWPQTDLEWRVLFSFQFYRKKQKQFTKVFTHVHYMISWTQNDITTIDGKQNHQPSEDWIQNFAWILSSQLIMGLSGVYGPCVTTASPDYIHVYHMCSEWICSHLWRKRGTCQFCSLEIASRAARC